MTELGMNHEMNEEIEVQRRTVDIESHNEATQKMNKGQKELFDRIIADIEKQEEKVFHELILFF